MSKLKQIFPILDWLPNYKKAYLRGDVVAGLTVGIMLVPQGMAYAILAGLPPIYGLYAAIIPQLIYAIFGTSRQLAVGPVAMDSLLVAVTISQFAEAESEEYIALAILLALIVGAIQLLMGLLRMGFLVNFLSRPVLSGFTSAAALIIGFSQLKYLMGVDIPRTPYFYETVVYALQMIGELNPVAFAIGTLGILLIIGVKKIHKSIPAPLLVVVLGILGVYLLGLQTVDIVGAVPSGIPAPRLPLMSWERISQLLPAGLTIALIAFMEAIAVAKVAEARHKDYKLLPNQELVALGMGNFLGSFFQSFPTTGGFSRTAVNDQAGAKTNLAAIISALFVLLTLFFLTPLFYYLPKAILASIIMVAVFKLIKIEEARQLWQKSRSDFWLLLATFVATLTIGIQSGILLGLALSLAFMIYKTTRPHIAILGRIKETDYYRNIDRFEQLEQIENVLILRFDSQVYFANAAYFKSQLEQAIFDKTENLKLLILQAEGINSLDWTGLNMFFDLVGDCRAKGIGVYLSNVKGPIRDYFQRAGFVDYLGEENFFVTIQDAVNFYQKQSKTTNQAIALQTNCI